MRAEPLRSLTIPQLEQSTAFRIDHWITAFLVLGVFLRLLRYLLPFPLWGDEAFVAANFIEVDYFALLGPLQYYQICPPVFLWIQQAIVQCLGFSEYSLRLFPFLCGVASLFAFRHLAGRFVEGTPLLISVALFAVSYYPIRHGAEVKPYTADLLVSLGLLILTVEYLRHPQQTKWLWGLALCLPISFWFSFPAIFIAGGVSATLFVVSCVQRRWQSVVAIGLCQVVMSSSFAVLYFWIMRPIKQALPESMNQYWQGGFPPTDHLLDSMQWFLRVHTDHMMAYPIGGDNFGSIVTTVCVAAAVGCLIARRQWTWLTLLLAPCCLGIAAAFLRAYPYGGSARIMQYLAPVICLLAGLGVAWIVSRPKTQQLRKGCLLAVLGLYLVLGLGQMARDATQPYKTTYDLAHNGFARWFWEEVERDAKVICLHNEAGIDFNPRQWEAGISSVYLCYQHLYRKRDSGNAQEQPHRYVVFRGESEKPATKARRDIWLHAMQQQYSLQSETIYPVNQSLKKYACEYVVYEFVPLRGPTRIATQPNSRDRSADD